MKYSGVSFGRGRHPVLVYGGAYVFNVVVAASLARLLGARHDWLLGVHAGLWCGLTFVGAALGVIYLFESRPWQLWLLNTGYQVLNFAAMGAVVGAWH